MIMRDKDIYRKTGREEDAEGGKKESSKRVRETEKQRKILQKDWKRV